MGPPVRAEMGISLFLAKANGSGSVECIRLLLKNRRIMAHHFSVLGFETTYDQKNPLLRGMPSKQPHQATTDIKFRSIVLMSILELCTIQKTYMGPFVQAFKRSCGSVSCCGQAQYTATQQCEAVQRGTLDTSPSTKKMIPSF
jgi:hypothetical protein